MTTPGKRRAVRTTSRREVRAWPRSLGYIALNVAEERGGTALGNRWQGASRFDGNRLAERAHEIDRGDDVAAVDAPPEDRFGDAILNYHQQLAQLAYMVTGDETIAESAVTEAYARLWPKFRRGRIEVLPRLTAEVLAQVRERARRGPPRDVVIDLRDDDPVWLALRDLPIEQRIALVLHLVMGLPSDEIADLVGDSAETVTARVETGLGRLAETIVAGPNG
jgi:RNA polymerase sigma-70 factor (ECF subfamily)